MIRTEGRPPINVTRRDSGGYIISQNRNRIWLSESEAAQLIEELREENH